MEASKTEQMVAALETELKRDLTDEEVAGIEVWSKSFELAHFISGFPQEWKLFKEMLESYRADFKAQWERVGETDPEHVGSLDVLHAQLYAANKLVSSFIRDVEAAPQNIREVPEVVAQNAGRLRAIPS
jgi:hypothetical protein